ncbi:hypothetical protein [Acetobacter aceti]|uniref:hypothetical protein n=1 Tax=Acetobacter aceti TaxID=435 RepID=UPI0015E156E4|nr:hypothetical protein [Acetobacter aceti]
MNHPTLYRQRRIVDPQCVRARCAELAVDFVQRAGRGLVADGGLRRFELPLMLKHYPNCSHANLRRVFLHNSLRHHDLTLLKS